MMPTVLTAIAASGLWWTICCYVIYREQHDAWLAERKRPQNDSGAIDHQLVDTTRRLLTTQRGSLVYLGLFGGDQSER